MKVDVSRPEKNIALLHIEVDTEQIGRVRESVYRRLVRRYNVPGFRKGKAPPFILENYLGREAFDREVLDDLLDQSYREALDEAGVDPVSPPEVDLKTWERGLPLVYEARLTTKPEVVLGQYTGLHVPKEQPQVTDEEVTQEMEAWRQRLAQPVDAPEGAPLAQGSLAVIDFAGFINDEPVEGTSAEDYSLEIGRGGHIPGFEEQLIGLKVGDRHDVKVTFPDDAGERIAGKEVTFRVAVKAHRQRQLPEADDQFAGSVAPLIGVKLEEEQSYTIAELTDELRRRLQVAADRRAKAEFATGVLKQVVERAEVDIPEVMVGNRTAAIRRDFEHTLDQRGLTLDEYLAARDETEEMLAEKARTRAEAELKRDLVIEAVARREGITATDHEVDERIVSLARMYGQDPVEFRSALEDKGGIEGVRAEIIEQKAVDFLIEAQVQVSVKKEGAEEPGTEGDRNPAVEDAPGGPAGTAEPGENNTPPVDVGIDRREEETPRKPESESQKGDRA